MTRCIFWTSVSIQNTRSLFDQQGAPDSVKRKVVRLSSVFSGLHLKYETLGCRFSGIWLGAKVFYV